MSKRGGKREGSGRKLKYNEPTITLSFKVPESKKLEFKEYCQIKLLCYVDEYRSKIRS